MQWHEFKNLAIDSMRVCARCGAFNFRPLPLFCEICDFGLKAFELPLCRTVSDQKFPVYSHFVWNSFSESHLRALIYGLKGGHAGTAIKSFAESFSWNLGRRFSERLVFIPPPSRSGAEDHASVWAKHLASVWKAEVWKPLNFVSSPGVLPLSQKQRSLQARGEIEFEAVKIAKPFVSAKLIFVDDVLTTGSTARAAFKALGEPKGYEAWTLAWRPKLAGNNPF